MKNIASLTLLSFLLLCACSAKNTTTVNDSGLSVKNEAANATEVKYSIIKGSFDQNGKVVITHTTFEKGSSEIPKESDSFIKEIADYFKNNTAVSMNVLCYTGADGSPEYCMDLSKERAKNISEKLKKYGIEEERINYKGMGWNPEEEGERIEIELVH